MPEDIYAGFARRLPRRIELVEKAVHAARANPAPELIGHARREAHKLAGTAGSYGHYLVSIASRAVEQALEPPQPDWSAVGDALDDLLSSDSSDRAPASPAEDSATGRRRGSVPRVLIVDADPESRERVAALLERQLVEAVCADPAHAYDYAMTRDWDALLIDADIDEDHAAADEDPLNRARALRALAGGNSVPLAIMSSQETLEERVAASHAGATLFLPKPLSLGGISDAIATLWALARARRPRVLAVDDDPDFLAHVAYVLGQDGNSVIELDDPQGIVAALREHRPDALLLDVDMPGYSGPELCAMLRASREYRHLPVLFVTGQHDAQCRREAFEAGADDYFLKPIVPLELQTRVRARIERTSMLRAAAETDTLTGLPLRRVFVAGMEVRLSEAIRREAPLALALIDLDHFKQVNDDYGHLAGDRVLSELGALLATRFRGEDLRCRWGGEEFALAFPGEPAETIHGVLDDVLAEFSSRTFVGDDGEKFSVTFSAGVAEVRRDGATLDALVRVADRRLYEAKQAGRARIVSGAT